MFLCKSARFRVNVPSKILVSPHFLVKVLHLVPCQLHHPHIPKGKATGHDGVEDLSELSVRVRFDDSQGLLLFWAEFLLRELITVRANLMNNGVKGALIY